MSSIFVKNSIQEILKTIYENIYLKFENKFIYVFLCGGSCKENSKEIRNDIRDLLLKNGNISVLYPEDVFFEKNEKKLFPDKDLLELETVLANNSDIVCIICESYGSASELGAFTNRLDNALINKVVSVIYSNFEGDSSFINDGPIHRIKKNNKNNACVYDNKQENKNKLCNDLLNVFKNIKRNHKQDIIIKQNSVLTSFISLASLYLMLIYFLKPISGMKLERYTEEFLNEMKVRYEKDNRDLSFYHKIAIRYLVNSEYIKYENENSSDFILTEKGNNYVEKHLKTTITNPKDIKRLENLKYTTIYNRLYTKNKKKGDYVS